MAGDTLKVEDSTWDAEVMKASELVMVDFWAVWCGPCQMVAPIIDELAKEYAGKLKVRKLNTDENPEVAGRYQVMSIPTILFFKNGQPVDGFMGAIPESQLKTFVQGLIGEAGVPDAEEKDALKQADDALARHDLAAAAQLCAAADGDGFFFL